MANDHGWMVTIWMAYRTSSILMNRSLTVSPSRSPSGSMDRLSHSKQNQIIFLRKVKRHMFCSTRFIFRRLNENLFTQGFSLGLNKTARIAPLRQAKIYPLGTLQQPHFALYCLLRLPQSTNAAIHYVVDSGLFGLRQSTKAAIHDIVYCGICGLRQPK